MRKQVEEYLLGLGWHEDLDGYLLSPGSEFLVEFDAGDWLLNSRRVGETAYDRIDEGDTLGELKLALAGLEAQATQGAI